MKLDRIKITTANGNEHITFDKEKVMEEVRRQTKQWFRERRFEGFEEDADFKEEYKPREYVDDTIYDNMDEVVTEREVRDALRAMGKHKATGPSGVSRELFVAAGDEAIEALRLLVQLCLDHALVPEEWLTGTINPIPKNEEWGADYTNTRPIALLETGYKLIEMIMWQRLGPTLREYNVLRGRNTSVLKGESTEPILHIIQAAIEDCIENDKEMYILLLDIKKAFDSASSKAVMNSHRRIKLPYKYSALKYHTQKEPTARIRTHFGDTEAVEIGSMIQQGSILGPPEWRIFWDTFLCVVDRLTRGHLFRVTMRTKHLGKDNWEEKELTERVASLAFVDDTTTLVSSWQDLEIQRDLMKRFLQGNGIEANTKKTKVLGLNTKVKEKTLRWDENQEVEIIRGNGGERILGNYYTATNRGTLAREKIKEQVETTIAQMQDKRITGKSAVAIINEVLLQQVQYKWQTAGLTHTEVEELYAKAKMLVKHKAHMRISTPNATLEHSQILALKNWNEIYNIDMATKVTCWMNEDTLLGRVMRIRAAKLQQHLGLPHCIFKEPYPVRVEKGTTFWQL